MVNNRIENRRRIWKWAEGVALLAAGALLIGCTAKSAPPASARARERAAPHSAVRAGRVSGIKITGLRISIILGGGRVVYLPDGHYRHRDGYVLIVSGGKLIGLDGIPPGQIVSARARASNPGRGRGKSKVKVKGKRKSKVKIKIKALKVKGTRITFIGDDDGTLVLASGAYTSSEGKKIHIKDGEISSVELGD